VEEESRSNIALLTGEEEHVRVLVLGDLVRALARLHAQEADDVAHGLCTDGDGQKAQLLESPSTKPSSTLFHLRHLSSTNIKRLLINACLFVSWIITKNLYFCQKPEILKALGMANHAHTWWYNWSPLRHLINSLNERTI